MTASALVLALAALLTAALVATLVVGLVARWMRHRPHRANPAEVIDPCRLGAERLGTHATLLQFSTRSCLRSPAAHHTLRDIATRCEGVVHLDVDLTDRPDIVRHFNIHQTPTTLLLDERGVVQARFGGTPSRGAVEVELAGLTAPAVAPVRVRATLADPVPSAGPAV